MLLLACIALTLPATFVNSFDSNQAIEVGEKLLSKLTEKLERLTNKKVILVEKKSKYKNAKEQIAKMQISPELKERILSLVNSGTRISDKHPVITGLTMAPELVKKIKEKNLPDGFGFGADKNGFFVYTHRARCKSHENPEDIAVKEIKFIDSTG